MRVFRGFDNLPEITRPVVAVGSFDGVHRGHRLLISQLCDLARQENGESVIVTFDPHPRQVLKGANKSLSTIDEKLTLLSETEIDNVIIVNFTQEFSRISHTTFIEEYIIGKLRTHILVTGQEHNFGHNRAGNIATVKDYGIRTMQLERFENISSTLIRSAIENGEMDKASSLLGRNGYLLQTPITDQSKLLPPDGSYIVEIDGLEIEMDIKACGLPQNRQNIGILRKN